jgi:acyl-CoA dehydrogenase
MEFELSRQQQEIQKAVREFVKGEFKKEVIEELLEKHEYPERIWKMAAELGFIGIHFPEKYSGMGLGCLENIIVAEELARGDSTVGTCLLIADFASEIVLHFGSEEQKA